MQDEASGVREEKLTEQSRPAGTVAQGLRDQVPVRPDLPDLVVADREEHEVQVERLYLAAEFPFQAAYGLNGPHVVRRPCGQASSLPPVVPVFGLAPPGSDDPLERGPGRQPGGVRTHEHQFRWRPGRVERPSRRGYSGQCVPPGQPSRGQLGLLGGSRAPAWQRIDLGRSRDYATGRSADPFHGPEPQRQVERLRPPLFTYPPGSRACHFHEQQLRDGTRTRNSPSPRRRDLDAHPATRSRPMIYGTRPRATVIALGWIRSLVCPPGEVIVTCVLTLRLSPVPTTIMSGRRASTRHQLPAGARGQVPGADRRRRGRIPVAARPGV